MRNLRLVIVAALLAPAVGCNWMKEWREQVRPKSTSRIEPVSAQQLVTYLNDRAARLQSIEYGDTRMRVSGKGIPVPATLDGNLAAVQPRSFRMVSAGRVASAKVDMGSNDELFWVYMQAPGEQPLYVFATHADFEGGRAKLPGGVPFEPDWVMQALGMTTFSPSNAYEEVPVRGSSSSLLQSVPIDEKERTYTLRWPATTPGGREITKEVVFDTEAAGAGRSQIRKHVIRDRKTNKVLAFAEIKAAQTAPAGTDPKTGLPMTVQYPTHVVLRWEEQRFEMDLNLEKAQVNQGVADDAARRALFIRPDIRGATPIDLAKYEFTPPR
jgi:hypothetical protein